MLVFLTVVGWSAGVAAGAQTGGNVTAPNASAPAAQAPAPATPPAQPCTTSADASPTALSDHLQIFECETFNWGTLADPLIADAGSYWVLGHPGYAAGWGAFGTAYRVNLVEDVSSDATRHLVFPAVFHQDERYEPLGQGHPWIGRAGHVLRHLILTANDDHTATVFNMSALPAVAANAGLDYYYKPASQRIAKNTAWDFASGVADRVLEDSLHEFSPEIHALLPKWLADALTD